MIRLTFDLEYLAIYCSILSYNNETRLINIGDNLRKIFGYVYSNSWIKFEF